MGLEATLGYYAGYSFDVPIWKTNFRVPMTPFFSAGLTQVSVPRQDGESEYKSGVTWAVCLLVQNWGGVTIGLTYGQDRIGDPDFNHEGDGWVSFSVGWEERD